MIVRYTNFLKLSFVVLLRTAFGDATTPSDYRYLEDENDPNCKLRIYRAFPKRTFNPPILVVSADQGDARMRYLEDEEVQSVYRVTNETVVNDTVSAPPVRNLVEVKDDVQTYTEGTDFTLDATAGVFTWITPKPATYFTTYDTFKFISKDFTTLYSKIVQSQMRIPVKITVYALSTTDRERLTDLVVLYFRHVFRSKLKQFTTYSDIRVGGETQTVWDNQQLFSNTVTVDCWSAYAHEVPYNLFNLIEQINLDIEIQNLGE